MMREKRINHKMVKGLLTMLLFLSSTLYVHAADEWRQNSHTKTSWDRETGIITIDICYYDFAGAAYDGGLYADDGYMNLDLDNIRLKITCADKATNLNVTGCPSNVTWGNDYTDGEKRWVKIRWQVKQSDLNNFRKIKYTGRWWRRYAQKDVDINGEENINPDWSRGNIESETPISIARYTNIDDLPVIEIEWNRKGYGNANGLGTPKLYDENGTLIKGYKTIGNKFYLPVTGDDAIDLSQSKTFIIKQSYIPSEYNPSWNSSINYETNSNIVRMEAYPQIASDKDFSATFNSTTRKVNLKWRLPSAPSTNYINDRFIIKTTKTLSDGTIEYLDDIAIDYETNIFNYSIEIPIERGELSSFNYTIYRDKLVGKKGWEIFARSTSININTVHATFNPTNPPKAVLDENNKTVTLSWDVIGNIWSDGSTMTITRKNLTTQQTTGDVLVVFSDLSLIQREQTIVDNTILPCNQYEYIFEIKPNASYGAFSPMRVGPIGVAEIGELRNLKVSKGYFSNRVELSWETVGGFDDYAVERKESRADDSSYIQIATLKGSATGKLYHTTDIYGEAGVVYDYRVKGLVSCYGKVTESEPLTDIGFRTPTGDLYGQVTFENNQAEEGVEVILETLDQISGKSIQFTGNDSAKIENTMLLSSNTDSITLQAWISPEVTEGANQSIIKKDLMYDLGIDTSGKVYFWVENAGNILKSDSVISKYTNNSKFIHISAVYSKKNNSVELYINGLPNGKRTASFNAPTSNDEVVVLGDKFKGTIDEVRIWDRPLSASEILRDYSRYLTGSELGLIAYYTFNYGTSKFFYDTSFRGAEYNANHGIIIGNAILSEEIPSTDQLGYKGLTTSDGTYNIRSIPYVGNGSAYSIIARKGIHVFEPNRETRFIGPTAASHTVNFVDKSTFIVKGKVVYRDGTFPVKGANFRIDGVACLSNKGEFISTSNTGEFEIRVPVGTHEVKVEKFGHAFRYGGRICDQYLQDLNYQDDISEIILSDTTTIRYIGRIAGGAQQEAHPYGHSLSTNNLSDNIKIRIGHSLGDTYKYHKGDSIVTVDHFKPSNKDKALSNTVRYTAEYIEIIPNLETGEFVADIFPENYTGTISISGYDDAFSPFDLRVSDAYAFTSVPRQYEDSITVNDKTEAIIYNDTVHYQFAQKFIKRVSPMITVEQVNVSNTPMGYYGKEEMKVPTAYSDDYSVTLYDKESKKYTFGMPVFNQNEDYKYRIEVFESYDYYSNGVVVAVDKVPTTDATVKFINTLALKDTQEKIVLVDSLGVGYYKFKAGEPNLTTAKESMTASFVYGPEDDTSSKTPIFWEQPTEFANGEAYLLGSHQNGTDFVTAGPNELLTVLRDPPGSNSYAYLEKGVTITQSASKGVGAVHEGSESITTGVKQSVTLIQIVPVTGTGSTSAVLENESGVKLGVEQEVEGMGTDSYSTSSKFTTRFQTSSDPDYVGPMADLYIGYSTNISFGETKDVTIVSKKIFDEVLTSGQEWETVYSDPKADWVMVQNEGLSAKSHFNTLFAYPQIYIEETLIPKLCDIRNSILILPNTENRSKEQLQAIADSNPDSIFYLSKVPFNSEDFGKKGSYDWITNKDKGNIRDTIEVYNNSIENWYKHLSENERKKVKVESGDLLQNYSFHGASEIEYTEEYTTTTTHTATHNVTIKGVVSNEFNVKAFATLEFSFEEKIGVKIELENSTESENTHSKGFVLAEEGTDYISVDVYREPGWKKGDEWYGPDDVNDGIGVDDLASKSEYGSFIFKTKGGSTSCPYEDEYVAQYFEPERRHVINEATLRKEVPRITVEKNSIENVPSGETAKIMLYLRNESESNEDYYYDLKLVDSSNPNGARLSIDGTGLGNGRSFLVPSGNTLVKTLEVGKGRVLNYDDLKLVLLSQCQGDPTANFPIISDTVTFHVHFVPSCSDIEILSPSNNWTYNTELLADTISGSVEHYMNVVLNKFDVNYDDFDHIKLQYKSASASDREWITLSSFYNDSTKWELAKENGITAEMIKSTDAGKINYKFYMDNLPDQYYDMRAVTVCNINNLEVENYSSVASGIKDMYNPRLFGAPQPSNGILTIEDEIRLNFNEPIAQGLMSKNNFQVTGIRNGSVTDHSTAVQLDGISSYMQTEFARNLSNKDLTFEVWINPTDAHNGTIFSHGDINDALELSFTADSYMKIKIGNKEVTSQLPVKFDKGTWAHVALVINNENNSISGYYNFNAVIANAAISEYRGSGPITLGRNVVGNNHFNGKMHTARLWDKVRTSGNLQLGSLEMLSGTDNGLIAYYPMKEGRGNLTEDKARGAHLVMTNCEWSLPNGFAAQFDGTGYLSLETSAVVATSAMNYTIEFWFKANGSQRNAVMLSNGRGEGDERGGSENTFAIGWDENGNLHYSNNNLKHLINGRYADNQWHHLVMTVSRTTGFAQIFMDGDLNTFFDAEELGGIAAANTFVGARGWYHKDNGVDLIVDNHFNGAIDEIRIWNLNKTQTIIETFNNEKLNGDEMGLMAYYPFEKYITHQGMNLLEKSLDDHKMNTTAKEALTYGGFAHTTDKAPVKDKGPVANLSFDFVVNNDALIINLTENAAKIEKTIITFTAMDVRDVNGNKILSPITWTAYIDRNQLRWSDDNLTIEKDEYTPYEFTLQAVNKGGQIQNYSISNQPSWLDISPKRGNIEPTKSANITFTIDEGLNVGTYNEVIYLTNSNGVAEALELTVTVNGEEPDWNVNPADYRYNMSVFGKIRFKNIFSSDKRDKLAAFQNGKCIGVANSTYSKELDMWYVMLTAYNNSEKSDGLSFRMWEAKTGKTYEAIPAETIMFSNNAIYGSPVNPIIFDGQNVVFQNIVLEKGWNWISFNLANHILSDINATLKNGSWTSSDIVKTLDFSENYTSNTKIWKGTLSRYGGGFNNNEMYWMKVDKAQRISVSGTVIDPIANPITIKKGAWNPIGYYPTVNLPLKTALSGYDAVDGDVIKTKDGFAMYYRNTWVGSLTYMEVNCGYMLRNISNVDKMLVYPTAAASNVNSKMPITRLENTNQYVGNMNIIATSDVFSKGDKVYAIINGDKRGVSVDVDINGKTLMFITVAGDETSESDQVQFVIEYANGGEQTAVTRLSYNTNSLHGSVDKPIDLRFYDEEMNGINVSPVPFNESVTITARATKDATIYVEIYDISSHLIYRSEATAVNEGMDYIQTINTSSFAQGTYLITVYENDEVTTCKALKK